MRRMGLEYLHLQKKNIYIYIHTLQKLCIKSILEYLHIYTLLSCVLITTTSLPNLRVPNICRSALFIFQVSCQKDLCLRHGWAVPHSFVADWKGPPFPGVMKNGTYIFWVEYSNKQQMYGEFFGGFNLYLIVHEVVGWCHILYNDDPCSNLMLCVACCQGLAKVVAWNSRLNATTAMQWVMDLRVKKSAGWDKKTKLTCRILWGKIAVG